MRLVVHERSDVVIAIIVDEQPLAVGLVVPEKALEISAVGPELMAEPLSLVVLDRSFVEGAICELVDRVRVGFVFRKFR